MMSSFSSFSRPDVARLQAASAVASLHDQCSTMSRALIQVQKTVEGIRQDKETQATAFRDLKDEVLLINQKLQERHRLGLGGHRLEQVHSDISFELSQLQHSVRRLQGAQEGPGSPFDRCSNLQKDIQELRQLLAEEANRNRLETDGLKLRLLKYESEIQNLHLEVREVSRRQSDIESRMDNFNLRLAENAALSDRTRGSNLEALLDQLQSRMRSMEIRLEAHCKRKPSLPDSNGVDSLSSCGEDFVDEEFEIEDMRSAMASSTSHRRAYGDTLLHNVHFESPGTPASMSPSY